MNRVQTVTQKHYRVEKPGQKPNRVHEHPTGPACEHKPRARGRVVGAAAVSWPWPLAVSQGVMAVSWPSAERASAVSQRASASPCAVSQDTPLLARLTMSRYKTWPCNTIPYQLCSLSRNTRNCIAIQFL